MKNPYRITRELPPNEKDFTQFGFITNAEWCEREAARIRAAGGQAEAKRDTLRETVYIQRPIRDVCTSDEQA